MRLAMVILLAAGAAFAQNHDLGLLVGIYGPSSQTVNRSATIAAGPSIMSVGPVTVKSSAGGSFQVNYAMQLNESSTGRLYLELPLLLGNRDTNTVEDGAATDSQVGLYFTPGVRYNVNLTDRVSVYGVAGLGVATFGNVRTEVGKGAYFTNDWTSSFAGEFGGGLDFRMTRLLSLRGEVRDFISRRGIGLSDGRNHTVFSFGMGFHW